MPRLNPQLTTQRTNRRGRGSILTLNERSINISLQYSERYCFSELYGVFVPYKLARRGGCAARTSRSFDATSSSRRRSRRSPSGASPRPRSPMSPAAPGCRTASSISTSRARRPCWSPRSSIWRRSMRCSGAQRSRAPAPHPPPGLMPSSRPTSIPPSRTARRSPCGLPSGARPARAPNTCGCAAIWTRPISSRPTPCAGRSSIKAATTS